MLQDVTLCTGKERRDRHPNQPGVLIGAGAKFSAISRLAGCSWVAAGSVALALRSRQ